MNPGDTIVAISSAPGPAVRGIVRVAGPQAHAVVAALLPAEAPVRAALLAHRPGSYENARLTLAGWPPVPALLLVFAAPRSYSGDDVVEVHLPGSPVVLQAVIAALLRSPAETPVRHAEPGEFTLRAFLNGRLDLTQAEAVSALIGAREPDSAVRQFAVLAAGRMWDAAGGEEGEGGVSAAVAPLGQSLAAQAAAWRERLAALLARAELALDFSEDEDFWYVADPPRLAAELAGLRDDIRRRAAMRAATAAERGDLPDVVLLGPANAGKSSWFNLLAGEARAIVTRQPGTTRDALACEVVLPAGPRVRLWDTAGLGAAPAAATAPVDAAAEALARQWLRHADVLVWCWPVDEAPLHIPDELLALRGRRWLLHATKCDRPAAWSLAEAATAHGVPAVATSAREPARAAAAAFGAAVGEALAAWTGAVAGGRGRDDGSSAESAAGRGVLANARQAAHLDAAAAHLDAALPLAQQAETMELASFEMAAADRELAHLLGQDPLTGTAHEALLARIFATFCLGK